MRSPRQDAVWMGAAFAAELAAAVAVLAVLGTQKRGIDAGLAATARVSFLFFWLAYSGGALTTVFGPLFQPIKARGREFGLAFAAAHLVHMGLVVWLCAIGETPAIGVFLFFGTALVFTYALALFSIGTVQASLNPTLWWLLRVVGMNFIAYAFAVDFFRDPLDTNPKHLAEYVPFLVLSAAGRRFAARRSSRSAVVLPDPLSLCGTRRCLNPPRNRRRLAAPKRHLPVTIPSQPPLGLLP